MTDIGHYSYQAQPYCDGIFHVKHTMALSLAKRHLRNIESPQFLAFLFSKLYFLYFFPTIKHNGATDTKVTQRSSTMSV